MPLKNLPCDRRSHGAEGKNEELRFHKLALSARSGDRRSRFLDLRRVFNPEDTMTQVAQPVLGLTPSEAISETDILLMSPPKCSS